MKQNGYFTTRCYNPDGSLAWEEKFPNGATTVGLNYMNDVALGGTSQLTPWFLGLINNSGFSALSADDTMGSHTGWSEFTDYSESVRQTWTPGSSASGSVTNPTVCSFTNVTNGNVVYGQFLASDSTKGGAVGTLWATGAFSTPRTLESGQVLQTTYTNTLQ